MTNFVCSSGVELLMDYLEHVVPDDVRTTIDTHVAGCERCAAFIASYLDTPRILRDATAASMPADLQASLLTAVRRQRGAAPDPD